MLHGLNFGDVHYSTRRGVLIGVALSLVVGLAIYPLRRHDYEFLLVLPVVYAGVLAGRSAALATALISVLTFHLVTRFGGNRFEEDVIAFVTFLGSALAVGAVVGGGTDRWTLARQREEEQHQLQELNAQLAEHASRMAVLEQVDHQRMALLRSVSHDLRTPLATIRAVATDLRDHDLYDESTRYELLKSVSDEAERLDRLVGNLLSMSRIEAGSMRIDDQVVDLTELVHLTVLRLGSVIPHVMVEVEINPGVPLIDGDPVLLGEVISNLVQNAARYAPTGSTVAVQLSAHDGQKVALHVCDHGPGIDKEHAARVFEAFWRGPESNSSGLGLAIVRAIVEAHGGTIELADTPGGGATFTVVLPAREDALL